MATTVSHQYTYRLNCFVFKQLLLQGLFFSDVVMMSLFVSSSINDEGNRSTSRIKDILYRFQSLSRDSLLATRDSRVVPETGIHVDRSNNQEVKILYDNNSAI